MVTESQSLSGPTMTPRRVAITVFVDADGVDAADSCRTAQQAVAEALPWGTLLATSTYSSLERAVRVVAVAETNLALRSGALSVVPVGHQ